MDKKATFAEMLPLIEDQLSKGGDVRFKPNGTSMLPLIRQGRDEVVIAKSSGRLKKYDIPFYRRKNGQFVLHRVVGFSPDGSYIMCGDHQSELEKGITNENIIGVLTCINREGEKPIYKGTLRYFLWALLGPRYIKTMRLLRKIKSKLLRRK